MAEALRPFADDGGGMTLGGLTIENSTACVSLSGSLDLAKDRRGLDHAKALHKLLAAIVAALEAEKDLPEEAEKQRPAPTTRKPNPFT